MVSIHTHAVPRMNRGCGAADQNRPGHKVLEVPFRRQQPLPFRKVFLLRAHSAILTRFRGRHYFPDQRQGVGMELLYDVFHFAHEMAERVGCVGVVVDAKPEAVRVL